MPQILVVPTSLILRHTLLGITCLVSLCDRGLLLFRQCRRIHCSAHFSICICLRDIFPVFAREHSCAAGMLALELTDFLSSLSEVFDTGSCLQTCITSVLEMLIDMSARSLDPFDIVVTLSVAVSMLVSSSAASSAYPNVCMFWPCI